MQSFTHSRRVEKVNPRHRHGPQWFIIYINDTEVHRSASRECSTAFMRGIQGFLNGEGHFPTPYDRRPRHKLDMTTFTATFAELYEEGWEAAEQAAYGQQEP